MPPLFLRTVRENRWYKDEAKPFLEAGDVPADPLQDLRSGDNLLSVWEVANDLSNVERIVRAVMLNGGNIDNMGYVLFDSALLPAAGIDIITSEGKSPDAGANSWHRDLAVSGKKLVALTKIILETELEGGNSGTIPKIRMRELVTAGLESKELEERCRKLLKSSA